MFGMSLFEQIGGEAGLRKVVSRFVDRMFDDAMIGYLFRMAKREHIKGMEYEFAVRHLAGPVRSSGPPLAEVQPPHRMSIGQFDRRTTVLSDTLVEMGVPSHVRGHWIQQIYTLRHQILSKSGTDPAPIPPQEQEQEQEPNG